MNDKSGKGRSRCGWRRWVRKLAMHKNNKRLAIFSTKADWLANKSYVQYFQCTYRRWQFRRWPAQEPVSGSVHNSAKSHRPWHHPPCCRDRPRSQTDQTRLALLNTPHTAPLRYSAQPKLLHKHSESTSLHRDINYIFSRPYLSNGWAYGIRPPVADVLWLNGAR